MSARSSGDEGERVVATLLEYEGWQIRDRQFLTNAGHRVDFLAIDPDGDEVLVEVKVWATKNSGRDTVKKAVGVAYDLREDGERRPFVLVLSHALVGVNRSMLDRAEACGAIARVRTVGFVDQ